MKPAKIRNYGCRIKDSATYKDMRCLFLENRYLRVGILLDKGSDIFEFLYKPLDMDMVWLSPFGISNPQRFNLTKSQPAGRFMDYYQGGWQEIFPNGGGSCQYQGVEWGQHEEAALLPWSYRILRDEPEQIEVELSTEIRAMPLRLVKRLRLVKDQAELFIEEEAVNLSSVDLEVVWGHHLAYGRPFLGPGCTINIPAAKGKVYEHKSALDENIRPGTTFSWPHLPLTDGGTVDLSLIAGDNVQTAKFLYLSGLDQGRYEIINPRENIRLMVKWDKKVMPYVWYWQEFNKTRGYPWYKMSRVFGLEPFSTDIMGLDKTVAEGRGITIASGSQVHNSLTIGLSAINKEN